MTYIDSLFSLQGKTAVVIGGTGVLCGEIAQAMHLSPKTVATYKYRIFEKLDTRSDVDMTRMALRYGLVGAV